MSKRDREAGGGGDDDDWGDFAQSTTLNDPWGRDRGCN